MAPLPLCLHARGSRRRLAFPRADVRRRWGIYEDPATGSAASAFAGVLMAFEPPDDGERMYLIEQGYEMGRPSQISLALNVEGGHLVDATVGGSARIVCQGFIEI